MSIEILLAPGSTPSGVGLGRAAGNVFALSPCCGVRFRGPDQSCLGCERSYSTLAYNLRINLAFELESEQVVSSSGIEEVCRSWLRNVTGYGTDIALTVYR